MVLASVAFGAALGGGGAESNGHTRICNTY